MRIYKNKFLIIIFILIYSCGYKIMNKTAENFNILEIQTSGDQRINYKIKNKLLFSNSKDNKDKFILEINTIKKKTIKNKNINNEITSYNLAITTEVSYGLSGKLDENNFIITENGDFKVSNQRQKTLDNEKSLTEILTDNIIEKIKFRLNNIINDS